MVLSAAIKVTVVMEVHSSGGGGGDTPIKRPNISPTLVVTGRGAGEG